MATKRVLFIVIDVLDLKESIICKSKSEVADAIGCHRTSLGDGAIFRKHYLIIPYQMK
jgi:hypothetical protein